MMCLPVRAVTSQNLGDMYVTELPSLSVPTLHVGRASALTVLRNSWFHSAGWREQNVPWY